MSTQRLIPDFPGSRTLVPDKRILVPRRTIVLDFDGTLAHNKAPFVADDLIHADPVEGAAEWCWAALEVADLVVFSGRSKNDRGIAAMGRWLIDHGFPVMPVMDHKPYAHAYVDDKAVRFNGDWSQMDVHSIVNQEPWLRW